MIDSFRGKYRFLSNFYPAPLIWASMKWPTAEHAYQAAKTQDMDARIAILMLETPGQAKRYGRRITIREDWDDIKLDKMQEIVEAKFKQNTNLMLDLLATDDKKLVEGNTWGDTFWGQCPVGVGENHLGKILMKIRADNA